MLTAGSCKDYPDGAVIPCPLENEARVLPYFAANIRTSLLAVSSFQYGNSACISKTALFAGFLGYLKVQSCVHDIVKIASWIPWSLIVL